MSGPLIIGITGASGAIYGVRMLEVLRTKGIPTHLIVSKSAAITLKEEADMSVEEVRTLATTHYLNTDIGDQSKWKNTRYRRPRWS
jgi:flavin prenyltransferase